jgi:hypothetical protein
MRQLRSQLGLLFISGLMLLGSPTVSAEDNLSQTLIDGVTIADSCLYALETSGNQQPSDCRILFIWHAEHWPRLKAQTSAHALPTRLTARDQGNLKAYEQTIKQVYQYLERQH